MNYEFSNKQLELRGNIENFIEQQYGMPTRHKIVASDQDYSKEIWQQMADRGWLEIPFSKPDDGSCEAAMDTYTLMEALAPSLMVEPLISSIFLSSSLISNSCPESIKQQILPDLLSGKTTYASALYEPNGRYNLAHVETRANPRRLGFSISGRKSLVLNGGSADKLIVSARTGGGDKSAGGISLFLLDPNLDGLTIHRYKNIDGHAAADIVLNEVFVDRRTLIGEQSEALEYIEQSVDFATLAICCEALGVMDTMTKRTLAHCKSRKQFGVPISNFQALRHKMADMIIEYEQARASVLLAAVSADNNKELAPMELSAAKYRVGIASKKIAQESIQLHGAAGIAQESDISHYFKRLTSIESQFGNSDFHLNRYIELSQEKSG